MTNLLSGADVVHVSRLGTLHAEAPAIFIGTDASAQHEGRHLTITHKGDAELRASVDFVVRAGDAEIAAWGEALGLGADAEHPFSGVKLVVKNASPDTCLVLLLLARRLRGVGVPEAWLKAARDWEGGHVTRPDKHRPTWAPLHSMLVHAALETTRLNETIGDALRQGVAYVRALVEANADPDALPLALPPTSREGARLHVIARARMAQEQLDYRNIRDHALHLQLALPLSDGNRRQLVDATFFTEMEVDGALKAWLRTDPDSWTGAGYTFIGLYRPQLIGTGNDITLSVDPDIGVWLEPLWVALETLEDAAWGGERPREPARPRMASFERPRTDGLTNSVEPWWDDGGSYTLVGAPGVRGGPSTRLSWTTVLDTIWRCFAPGGDIHVSARGGAAACVNLLTAQLEGTNLRRPLIGDQGPVVVDVVRRFDGEAPLIQWCPTIERALAALVDNGEVRLLSLPEPSGFDFFRIGGGAALVTANGVLLLASDGDDLFPAAELRYAAEEVAKTLATARHLRERLISARHLALRGIERGRGSDRRVALLSLTSLQIDARAAWPADAENGGGPVHAFREGCERRWRAQHMFDRVLVETQELEAMVTSWNELRTASLVNALAVYGFPAAVLGNLLGVAFAPMSSLGGWLNIAWLAVAWFAGLTLLVGSSLFVASRINQRRWIRKAAARADASSPPRQD